MPARRIFNVGGGLSQRTQETYLYRAKKIIEYFNKPPGQITNEELRQSAAADFFT